MTINPAVHGRVWAIVSKQTAHRLMGGFMPTLLHRDASPRGVYFISRQLSSAAVGVWKRKNPAGRVTVRDLTTTKMSFVDMDWISGSFTAPNEHTEHHKRALAVSDELISELLEADDIVIETPMYNFAVPARLKAWIDHVVRAGKTFQYSAAGPEGLATGRKAFVTIASARIYDEASDSVAYNLETPYRRRILGFIGITNAKTTVLSSSHVVMLSHAKEVANVIEEAAAGI
jgi:FMN-dependent NADH-azoreductase